jgi:hypothetical protein
VILKCDEMRGNKCIRVYMKMNVEGKKKRRKPKQRWLDTFKNDMWGCRKSRRVEN